MPLEVQADVDDVNALRLRGRVSTPPERRVLPSGDEVVTLRLVVRRPEGRAVDVLDVSVGPAPPARTRAGAGQVGRRVLGRAERLQVGDRVEVVGQLRRRWWDAGGARRSRLEVRATVVAEVVDPRGGPSVPDATTADRSVPLRVGHSVERSAGRRVAPR